MVSKVSENFSWTESEINSKMDWVIYFSDEEQVTIKNALGAIQSRKISINDISKDNFYINDSLQTKIRTANDMLMNGCGLVLFRGLDTAQYSQEELQIIFLGLGAHIGKPWAQNKEGELIQTVTDKGKTVEDPTSRGNEIGEIALPLHTDGADIVGLLCINKALKGGESIISNAVLAHNRMLDSHPELIALLYQELPFDYRGEQSEHELPFYMSPVFTKCKNRLFMRYIPCYIKESQYYDSAPRLTDEQLAAMDVFDGYLNQADTKLTVDLLPGDIQFINNYHVVHGRNEYIDHSEPSEKRLLLRLWLESAAADEKPARFQQNIGKEWNK